MKVTGGTGGNSLLAGTLHLRNKISTLAFFPSNREETRESDNDKDGREKANRPGEAVIWLKGEHVPN